ncbi:MAG: cytochrome c3 family protein [Planctomycetota bacterium]|jgi:formate-dependent nitrite reductase cytochrome c552 subunit
MSVDRRRPRVSGTKSQPLKLGVLLLSGLLLLSLASGKSSSAEEAKDSCVECHGKASFLVTNKKLYDYFRRWGSSIHKQEGVTCVDCHGGNSGSSDKEKAHGGDLDEAQASSAVNFRNIPRTCGECHQDIYEGFRESAHFEHVVTENQEDQGPTCVTCHGSINVAVLNVDTVEEACRACHNEDTENGPENAQEARALLNRFLSIHRYYRYITVRGDPAETKRFFGDVDAQIHDLSVTWHTFDLDAIGEKTEAVLQGLKAKRQEIARAQKKSSEDPRRSPE